MNVELANSHRFQNGTRYHVMDRRRGSDHFWADGMRTLSWSGLQGCQFRIKKVIGLAAVAPLDWVDCHRLPPCRGQTHRILGSRVISTLMVSDEEGVSL